MPRPIQVVHIAVVAQVQNQIELVDDAPQFGEEVVMAMEKGKMIAIELG
jgi:hypothetical protein